MGRWIVVDMTTVGGNPEYSVTCPKHSLSKTYQTRRDADDVAKAFNDLEAYSETVWYALAEYNARRYDL